MLKEKNGVLFYHPVVMTSFSIVQYEISLKKTVISNNLEINWQQYIDSWQSSELSQATYLQEN